MTEARSWWANRPWRWLGQRPAAAPTRQISRFLPKAVPQTADPATESFRRRRNDADVKVWRHANSATTVASVARLEALANVEAQNNPELAEKPDDEFGKHGCRLAYSSVLAVQSKEQAQSLLAQIFTVALIRNPTKQIGGMLFYDEQTNAIVQVLEGPSAAVRDLFYKQIQPDRRHTAVQLLWDLDVTSRRFEGFGMKLGGSAGDALQDGDAADDQQELLKLTYLSQLTAKNSEEAYADVQSILRSAFVTNPKLHIGGALFLNPRTLHVLQVLEGPQRAVRTLYEKIAQDSRHTGCKVLSEEIVQSRIYDQWGMMQGDASQADWSAVAAGGWGADSRPGRRRARRGKEEGVDDVSFTGYSVSTSDSMKKGSHGDGPSAEEMQVRLKAAEQRAQMAEQRADAADRRAKAAEQRASLAEEASMSTAQQAASDISADVSATPSRSFSWR